MVYEYMAMKSTKIPKWDSYVSKIKALGYYIQHRKGDKTWWIEKDGVSVTPVKRFNTVDEGAGGVYEAGAKNLLIDLGLCRQ